MLTDITEFWKTNRRWRAWMDANTKFVTPSTLQSLRHMRNECCEAADLISRMEHPEEARNNGRESTIEQELADVVVMALTVLSEKPEWILKIEPFDADEMCASAADAVMAAKWGIDWRHRVYEVISIVLAYPGLDLSAELDRCWRRLAWKHGGMALEKWLFARGVETARVNGQVVCASGWTEEILPMPWLVEDAT